MPTFDITMNIYLYLLTIVLSMAVGYLRRSRQLAKKQRAIDKLEGEVAQANAELLDSQREFCELEARMKDITNPVITMKGNKLEDVPPPPAPERGAIRTNRATGTD